MRFEITVVFAPMSSTSRNVTYASVRSLFSNCAGRFLLEVRLRGTNCKDFVDWKSDESMTVI